MSGQIICQYIAISISHDRDVPSEYRGGGDGDGMLSIVFVLEVEFLEGESRSAGVYASVDLLAEI